MFVAYNALYLAECSYSQQADVMNECREDGIILCDREINIVYGKV
jgi:uncharacterized protein YecT (DUF1311 family)